MAAQRSLIVFVAGLVTLSDFGSASQFLLYVGNYTGPKSKGIQAFRYDTKTLDFEPLGMVGEMQRPSFLTASADDRFLYAVSELGNDAKTEGFVYAFSLDRASGKLRFINRQPSGGGGACHLVIDQTGKYLLVANYGTGSIADFPLKGDGSIGPLAARVQFEGSGPNQKRQKGPHAHAVVLSKNNRFLFVPDLGADKIRIFRFDASSGKLTPNTPASASVKPGAGPRHFALAPGGGFAYVVDEMGSSVTAFRLDAGTGTLSEIQAISTLPDDFSGENNSAEIAIDPAGKFLYASNRGHNSIAMFAIDHESGKLARADIVPSQGATPRNFVIDPTGTHLLVANQDSDNIVVFERNSNTGKLTSTSKMVSAPSPVCLVFVPLS